MDQKEFLGLIQTCRRRLNMGGFLKNLAFALSIGAGAGIVLQVVSLLAPMYYVNVYAGIALLSAVAAAAAVSWHRRSDMRRAALVMDSFGFEERIITAYEHLRGEGMMPTLQRRDAMEQLMAHRDRIQIPLWPGANRVMVPLALLALMIGLAFVPSQVREQVREIHQIRQEARQKEQEIEEVMEELEKLEELEALTPEQQAALQEMIESLQSSMTEYSQATSEKALEAAGEKLNYKYEDMSSQIASIAQSIKNGAAVSPITAESMQAMADMLQKMSENPSQNGDNVASGQGDGQGQGNGQGDGQDQGNGQGDGQGQGNGQGDGQGQGNGQGDGQGQGNGQGDGQSQGNGQSGQGDGQNGQGRGTGTANNPHDYVSIPNAIADSGNLTGNAVDHDGSEYFRAQNGLSWEGEHMSYEEVIASYEENAYEGIATGRYPSGMEDVIREYFSSFK